MPGEPKNNLEKKKFSTKFFLQKTLRILCLNQDIIPHPIDTIHRIG